MQLIVYGSRMTWAGTKVGMRGALENDSGPAMLALVSGKWRQKLIRNYIVMNGPRRYRLAGRRSVPQLLPA